MSIIILKNSKFRDSRGERIHFPSDGKPYYDRALRRVFHSIKEKQKYLKDNNLIMDGSSDPKKRPIEAGDTRKLKVK